MRMSLGATSRVPEAERIGKTLARGERHATVLAVAAQKGGVGKTTTSVALASAWARFYGQRVLLVDLDPQGHVHTALRDHVHDEGGPLSSVLLDPRAQEVEQISARTRIADLFITPADPGLLGIEDRLASRMGKELVLRKALEITRSHYDLIVLDCPPNMGALTVAALVAADRVIVPMNPTALSVAGVRGLIRIVDEVRCDLNPTLEVLGVVVTRMDGRTVRTNDAVLDEVDAEFGPLMVQSRVGVCNALAEAQSLGQDIFTFRPQSRGAEQYKELAGDLLMRLTEG